MRIGGYTPDQIRKVTIKKDYIEHAEGSVLIEIGKTRVICTATVEDKVPPFLRDTRQGWVTAEYAMLPRSTKVRSARESTAGKKGGRTHEIQRLIGRSLRVVTDLEGFGERTVVLDCDVIQADGGTRTASITGAYVALANAFQALKEKDVIKRIPIYDYVAAISVGMVNGQMLLDLNYEEDSKAEVDMNLVMTGSGLFVEVQGTAERRPFSKRQIDIMIELASKGIKELIEKQREIIGNLI
ncbi:MAG: ribonuclease PH [Thermodesulfobacteriota bacterium]|nr:ribonuclease PH [Thermodesulfobacteriota bacterium]